MSKNTYTITVEEDGQTLHILLHIPEGSPEESAGKALAIRCAEHARDIMNEVCGEKLDFARLTKN